MIIPKVYRPKPAGKFGSAKYPEDPYFRTYVNRLSADGLLDHQLSVPGPSRTLGRLREMPDSNEASE